MLRSEDAGAGNGFILLFGGFEKNNKGTLYIYL